MNLIQQDNQSVISRGDIYAQLGIWILSLFVFTIFFDASYLNDTTWVIVVFYHAVGLLILGIWQMISSIVYLVQMKGTQKYFFRNNVLIGVLLTLIFIIVVFILSNLNESRNKEIGGTVFICIYFLSVHFFAIRYWVYIKKIAQKTNRHTNSI